ncbi:MAG TPA: peptidylprolyl isomerase [Anaerolineales bacterium]|nr:peptidylprolyl isomerase [Anaerolineales bacterium]
MPKQSSTQKVISKKHIARLERERRQIALIRVIAIVGILLVVGLLTYGYLKLNVLVLREPVAEVNGVKITTGEWQERVKFQRIQLLNLYNQYSFYQQNFGMDYSQQIQQISFTLQSPNTLGQQVLDQMTDEILIRQEAEKRGITVSPDEVEKKLQENFNFFPNGTPSPTVTPTEFSFPTLTSQQMTLSPLTATPTEAGTSTVTATATLDLSATPAPTSTPAPATPTFVPEPPTATATPYTLEGFKTDYNKMLENYKTYKISEKTIRSVYEADILRQKLMDQMITDVPRTEEQVWARHILVETEAEAKTIYNFLQQDNGANFAQFAKTSSKDTGSGANGGDLGWFGKGMMVPEFEAVAFKLKVGEISQPVKSQFGWHIIQVLGHQDLPLTDAQIQQKKGTEFSNWLADQRKKATIKTFDIWKERVPMEPTLQPQQ